METAANRHIKLFEKKHKIRTYESGEAVLVDLGKKMKVKKHIDKHPAIIVKSYSAGRYTVVKLAEVEDGELLQVDVDQIEPFYIREGSCYQEKIELETKKIKEGHYESELPTVKGQKRPASAVELSNPSPKKSKCLPAPEKSPMPAACTIGTEEPLETAKRSESYRWKLACENLLSREARRKPKQHDVAQ